MKKPDPSLKILSDLVKKEVKNFQVGPTVNLKEESCRHHLRGFCKRKDCRCRYDHPTPICPQHRPDFPAVHMKEQTVICRARGCKLRHPDTCSHYEQSRCFFGERRALSHVDKLDKRDSQRKRDLESQKCENEKLQADIETLKKKLSRAESHSININLMFTQS